jgi:N utilization substance protein B
VLIIEYFYDIIIINAKCILINFVEEFYLIMANNRNYNVRDSVFKLLFEKYWRPDDTLQSLIDTVTQEGIEEITISKKVVKVASGVLEHQSTLDETINKYLIKRRLDTIPVAVVTILRLAVYEILFDDKVPLGTAIHEAVKLAQVYSPDDVKFINGVLGAFSRDLSSNSDSED